MSQFIESILLQDGQMPLLPYHEKRLNQTKSIFFPGSAPIILANYLTIPRHFLSGIFKLRCIYSSEIDRVEFHSYSNRDIKNLKVVCSDEVIYDHKYLKRAQLDKLFSQRKDADEIIISKNGYITDAYYYNIALKKDEMWYTPSSPLLNGVRRSYLIANGILRETKIKITDLEVYDEISLINALTDLSKISIPVNNVQYE